MSKIYLIDFLKIYFLVMDEDRKIVIMVIYVILFFVVIFGNVLVIYVVFCRFGMKSFINFLLVNMVIVDFFFVLFMFFLVFV